MSTTVRTTIAAAAAALAFPALAQDAATVPEEATAAVEAATTAGLIETLASGEPYTAFIPTNDALTAAMELEGADAVLSDPTTLATVIQGYVVAGNVMAADAMTMVTDGGGMHTVDSLAGTPIELAMSGESLTVNGAAVTTPDLMIGNVTVHLIDTAFLPGDAAAASGG